MITRTELRERINAYLAYLPDTMTRRQVEEFVRESLSEALMLDRIAVNRIHMWWEDNRLRAEFPSRMHLVGADADIAEAIDDAVSRVAVNDSASLSPEEFSQRMRRLRGRK